MPFYYEIDETLPEERLHYRAWRTHQMSDHLPMWIELKVDLGPKYLARKMQPPD